MRIFRSHISLVEGRMALIAFLILLVTGTGCQTIQFERPHVLSETDWPTDGATDARTRAVQDSLALPLQEVWKYSANAGFGAASPLILQDRVLVGNRKGEVHSVLMESGRGAGFKQMGESIEGSPLIHEGFLFVPVAWGKHILVAYDLAKGTNRWRAKGVPFATSLIGHKETIVGVDLEGTLRAYSIRGGDEEWTLSLAPFRTFQASPVRVSDSSIVVADIEGTLYRVNLDTQQVEWTVSLDEPVYHTPAVRDGAIAVSSTRGSLFHLDAGSGATKWKWEGADHLRMGAPTFGRHEIIVGATDGTVRSLDRWSGEERWMASFDDVVAAAPLIVGSTVFVGTLGEEIAGLSMEDGEIAWRAELDGRVKSAMAVADGGLLVLTEPKWVVYFKPADVMEPDPSVAEGEE